MPKTKEQIKLDKLEDEFREKYRNGLSIPVWRIYMLVFMAKNDVWPDGRFTDLETKMWSIFRKAEKK